MKILNNKKLLLILPVVIIFLLLLFIIPNSKAIYRESLETSVNLNIENSKYTVVFNGNGSTTGTTASKECEYTKDCTLTKNGFNKMGYIFVGWSTTANGTKVYDDEDEVLNLAVTGDYPLYALWEASELIFENQNIEKIYNSDETQTIDITEASNGSGSYTYTKKSEKNSSNTNTNYISISGNKITVGANTPAGVYTVVITAKDTNTGASKDATYIITITKESIAIPACGSFTYNKSEQTLMSNTTEYTVTNNKGTNAGNYTVKVTPTGNYKWSDNTTGEKNVTCTIGAYDITNTATVVPTSNVTYNGSEYKPTPAVTVPLPSSTTTYTLTSSEVGYTYANNINAGEATITITGKGNYKGSKTVKFTINKAEGYITLDETNKNISYGTSSVSFNVSSSHGGEISVTDNNNTATTSKEGNLVTVSNLGTIASGTTVTVTVTSGATTNYTEASTTYTINITNAALTGGSVTITGKNVVGETLTASVEDTSPKGTYTYEWYRNTSESTTGGEKITNATGSTYQVTTSEVGKYIYVVVTASKENYTNTTFKDVVDSTNNTTASAKTKVAKPTATYCKTLTYNGNSQVLTNTAQEGYAFYDNSGINAGTYTITAKVKENYIWADYTTTDTTFNCSIGKKAITVTAGTSEKTYDGVALTNSTCTSAGLVSGHTVSCTMTSESTITNVGSKNNEIETYVISNTSENVTNNYQVTTAKGTLTINKATPTVTLTAKTGMTWNDSPQAANEASVTLVNGETYTGTITYTYYTNSGCSSGATTTAPTLAKTYYVKATTEAFGNYNGGASSCVAHTISVATPTVTLTAKSAANRVYTGSAIVANEATVSTPNGGGAITYTYYTNSGCTAGATTTAPTNVGTYYVQASVAAVANKTAVAKSGCVNHSITQKKATITITNASTALTYKTSGTNSYTYDGDGEISCQSSDETKVTCSVNTNTKVITLTPVAATTSSVTITVKASAGTNYSAADNKTFTVTVAKATPTVNLAEKSAANRVYTGSAIAANTATVTLVNSETYTGTINYTYYTNSECTTGATTTAPTAVGTYYAQASIVAQENYNAAKSACVNHSITQKKATITRTSSSLSLTYGVSKTNAYTYDGDGEVSCQSSDTTKVTCSVDTTNHVINVVPTGATTSSVTITISASAGTNYSAADNKTFTVTVAKATPTITLTAKTGMIWNDSPQAANTATVTLVNGETYTGIITYTYYTNSGCSSGATTTTPTLAKTYYVKATTEVFGNYNAGASSCVSHVISTATPTVTLTAKTEAERTYTGSAIATNTATVTPNGGGTITYRYYTNSTCTSGATTTAPTAVGTKYVQATVAAVTNKTTSATSECVNHTILAQPVNKVTNLAVSTSGVVSWTNSSNATGYQISIDGTNWTVVPPGTDTTSYNYLSTITSETGTRTVYVKAINSNTNYSSENSVEEIDVEVYTLTLNSNNENYGVVDPTTINVIKGATYTTSGTTLTLSDERIATATTKLLLGYNTSFSSWSSTSGTLNVAKTITATFTAQERIYNVTFNANTGKFSDSTTTNSVTYRINQVAYSHTSNVDDTGLKLDNYGNNWTNANITGTNRGDTAKAHVITFEGAESLTVDIYYNGQSTSYDWVTVWEGSHPEYTAASNYSSGVSGGTKLGGSQSGTYTVNGNTLTSMGHSTFTITGDTVTFGFKSNASSYGQGYGYYAIITAGTTIETISGTYKEPSKENYIFTGWNTESDGSGTTFAKESSLVNLENTTQTLYAQYRLPTATFTTGQLFNTAIKVAARQESATYSTSNSTITAFTKYNGTPTQEILNNATVVSADDSETEIYIWFDNGTIYWYTISDTVYFNPISTYMFNYLTAIDTIDLSEFNFSKVTSSSSIFSNTTNMTTLVTPKVNATSSISIGKTLIDINNTTYTSITSTMTPMTTLKVPYTITFDGNGGINTTCTSLTKQIYPGNQLGEIPTPTFTKVGYIVDAYQTEKDGGSAVTESTIPPSSITYYAKWVKTGVWADNIKNNNTYANANCESIQCMLEYFTQFREKRVDINGN